MAWRCRIRPLGIRSGRWSHCVRQTTPGLPDTCAIGRLAGPAARAHSPPRPLARASRPRAAGGMWGTRKTHAPAACCRNWCTRNGHRGMRMWCCPWQPCTPDTRAHLRFPPLAGSQPEPRGAAAAANGLASQSDPAPCPSCARAVPPDWDAAQRKELLGIAARVKAEHCASYTAVCLGLQAFVRSAAVRAAAENV